jgi:hypothetical protein
MRHALLAPVRPTIAADDHQKFDETVKKEYALFIIEKCLIGENVSAEMLYIVTGHGGCEGRGRGSASAAPG